MTTTKPGRVASIRPIGAIALVLIVFAVAGGIGWYLFRNPTAPVVPVDPVPVHPREAVEVPAVRFTDHTSKAGIRFRHVNGAFGKKLLPETMGSGVAFLDYNKDGKQDFLFVNSCYWPGYKPPGESQPEPTLALYRNKGDGTFEDVTAEAGLAITMYGMGVTVGDYDNDGWPDVFITGVGGNRLFHNEPDGKGGRRFVDATLSAGVGGPGGWPKVDGDFLEMQAPICFSTSAAFLDYDGDGRLDLFVCNYVTWSPRIDLSQPVTLTGSGDRAYLPPKTFPGSQCFLYRNLGGGRFEDVSATAGVQVLKKTDAQTQPIAKSLGVIVCDVDEDGWPDIFVANDTVRNFFFHNEDDGKGGRHFVEMGIQCGVAYSDVGQERGAMGIDWGEYRPGQSALLIGNFTAEPDTFLRRRGADRLIFEDAALAEGIAGPSRSPLKFGVFFFDYDLDGRPDFLTCNGHLEPEIAKVLKDQTYEQSVQLFWNTGLKRCFEPVPPQRAGPDLFRPLVGRGCAFGDIDGDGYLDVVLTANGGAARLLRNEGGTGNHWIRLVLEGDGKRSNTSAIGARVTLEAGGVVQHREVTASRGYLSQSELPVTFGLGKNTKVDRITIRWPGRDGGTQEVAEADRGIDQVHVIRQAAGK